MGIDYEEKAFYDILKAVCQKYEFEYPDDKMIELSKRMMTTIKCNLTFSMALNFLVRAIMSDMENICAA